MVGGTFLTVLLCHHLCGCASFKNNQLNNVGVLTPMSSENKKQTLTYTFSSWVDNGHLEKEKSLERIYEDEFTSVLNDSGYFSILESGDYGDIQIKAVLLVSYSEKAVRFGTGLSFLTLTLLPSWNTVNYKATVKVTTSDGINHDYILDDAVTRVIWFPMIFVTPFREPNPGFFQCA